MSSGTVVRAALRRRAATPVLPSASDAPLRDAPLRRRHAAPAPQPPPLALRAPGPPAGWRRPATSRDWPRRCGPDTSPADSAAVRTPPGASHCRPAGLDRGTTASGRMAPGPTAAPPHSPPTRWRASSRPSRVAVRRQPARGPGARSASGGGWGAGVAWLRLSPGWRRGAPEAEGEAGVAARRPGAALLGVPSSRWCIPRSPAAARPDHPRPGRSRAGRGRWGPGGPRP